MTIYRNISLIDDSTGEIFSSSTQKVGNKLKGGWIVVYKAPLQKLIKIVPNFATLKVYLMIAASQDYNKVTLISTKFISEELNMSYQTVWNAVKWLKLNGYIKDGDQGGIKGFVVNPAVTVCGKKSLEEKINHFIEEPEPDHDADVTEEIESDDDKEVEDDTIEYGDFPIVGERLF